MTTTSEATLEAQIEELDEKTSIAAASLKMARKQPVGVAGLTVVILMIVAALFCAVVDAVSSGVQRLRQHADVAEW